MVPFSSWVRSMVIRNWYWNSKVIRKSQCQSCRCSRWPRAIRQGKSCHRCFPQYWTISHDDWYGT
jgi:hypothetical protein